MAEPVFSDEWLRNSLEGVVGAERLAGVRAQAGSSGTLWEALVAGNVATNEQILAALSTRFRLKIADVHQVDPKVTQ